MPEQKEIKNEGIKIKCNHCGYVWNTKSALIYVCCPSCRFNVKKEDNEVGSDVK